MVAAIEQQSPILESCGRMWRVHRSAARFPLMSDQDLIALAMDLRKSGQRLPVIVEGDLVLDGRNRLRACDLAKMEPRIQQWDGQGSQVALIASLNGPRRHLNESQRALLAAELMRDLEEEIEERLKSRRDRRL